MNRPEMTNLNHQYAIRRVDMDFSWVPEPGLSRYKQYCRPLRAGVNYFTSGAAHATVNDGDSRPAGAIVSRFTSAAPFHFSKALRFCTRSIERSIAEGSIVSSRKCRSMASAMSAISCS
jgi:hypothetical protein